MKKYIIGLLVLVMLASSVESVDQQSHVPSFNQQMSKEGTASLGKILGSGILSSLFTSGNEKYKLRKEKDQEELSIEISTPSQDKENDESIIDKSLIQKGVGSFLGGKAGLSFENLIPRRRKFSQLDMLSKILADPQNRKGKNQKSSKEFEQLNDILLGKKQMPSEDVFTWQNPSFKEGEKPMHHSRIFGKRGQGTKTPEIKEKEVEQLLVLAMPSLAGGKIIRMQPFGFKKGILLNIDYLTESNQIFTIKARFRPRKHLLDIISLIQNTNPLAMVTDSSSSDSENQFLQFDVKPVIESQSEISNQNIEQTMSIIQKLFNEQKEQKQQSRDDLNKKTQQQQIGARIPQNQQKKQQKIKVKTEQTINEERKIIKKQTDSKQSVLAQPIEGQKSEMKISQKSSEQNNISKVKNGLDTDLTLSAEKMQSVNEMQSERMGTESANEKLSKEGKEENIIAQ